MSGGGQLIWQDRFEGKSHIVDGSFTGVLTPTLPNRSSLLGFLFTADNNRDAR
jgi:hypothetical protein